MRCAKNRWRCSIWSIAISCSRAALMPAHSRRCWPGSATSKPVSPWSACLRARMAAPARPSSRMRSTPILMPAVRLTSIDCATASSPIRPRSRSLPSSLCHSPPMTSWLLFVRQRPSSRSREAWHEQVLYDNPTALQKLKTGELAALVRVIGKPIDFFAKIPANSGLHFVPIRFSKTFAHPSPLGEFTNKEYPALVPEGQSVDTIAAPAALAVFNWPKGSDRYRRIERLVERLFTNWDKFLAPPRHPKWRDVNLAAAVPGWTRWGGADEMLRRIRLKDAVDAQVASSEFSAFLKGAAAQHLSHEKAGETVLGG